MRWHDSRGTLVALIQVVLASASLILLTLVQNPLIQDPLLQTWQIGQPVTTIDFSPDGKLLALGTENGTVQIRQVSNGKLLNTLSGLGPLTFSPDGKILASGSDGGSIHLWEANIGMSIQTFHGRRYPLKALAFSPDGKSLASVDTNGSIGLWKSSDWQLAGAFSIGAGQSVTPFSPLSLGFANTGRTLLVGTDDYQVHGWEVPGWNSVQIFDVSPVDSTSISARLMEFTSSGEKVAIAPYGSAIYIYDLSAHRMIYQLGGHNRRTGHQTDVWSMAFSPSGALLASGGGSCGSACSDAELDASVRIWQMSDGAELGKFEGHTDNVRSLAWSPDDTMLASGSDDGTLRLWKVK